MSIFDYFTHLLTLSLGPDDFKDDVNHGNDTNHQSCEELLSSLLVLKRFFVGPNNESSKGFLFIFVFVRIQPNIITDILGRPLKRTKTFSQWEFTHVVVSTLLSKNSSENFHVFFENFHVLSENFYVLSEFWDRTLLSVEPFPHKGQVKKQKAVEKSRFLFLLLSGTW